MKCFALLLALVFLAFPVRAQVADSARISPKVRPRSTAALDSAVRVRDSVARPPVSPKRAFLESLLVPGWGQASLHRSTAGGIFVALEATSIAMLIQSKKELNAARALAQDSVLTPSGYTVNPVGARVGPRKQAVEDWTALLIFTHLLAGADAFVAAHLWDVPVEVSGQASGRDAKLTAKIRF